MGDAKYDNRLHRETVAAYRKKVDEGEGWCTETICLMPSRYIEPGSPVDAAHTPDGEAYLGPAHAKCNRSEGGKRGRAIQGHGGIIRRWAL
jgi:hypothetical protein